MYTGVYTCTYISACVHMYTYLHVYIYVHLCAHTHTYIHFFIRALRTQLGMQRNCTRAQLSVTQKLARTPPNESLYPIFRGGYAHKQIDELGEDRGSGP